MRGTTIPLLRTVLARHVFLQRNESLLRHKGGIKAAGGNTIRGAVTIQFLDQATFTVYLLDSPCLLRGSSKMDTSA